jgi:hypothetical protein
LALYLIQNRMLLLLFGLALGDACQFQADTCCFAALPACMRLTVPLP